MGEWLLRIVVHFNMPPWILRYSKLALYATVIVVLLVIAIRVIRSRKHTEIILETKKLRVGLVILAISGIAAQVGTLYLRQDQLKILIPYLENHNIDAGNYYSKFISLPAIPNILLFTGSIIVFFILTKRKEIKY
jgi:hypothetical protein